LPVLKAHGFWGALYVLMQVLFSEEMSLNVSRRVNDIHEELLGREATAEEIFRHGNPIRYFQEHGEAMVADKVREGSEFKIRETRRGEVGRLSAAIEASPCDAKLVHQRSLLRIELEDSDGALDDLAEAIELDPSMAEAYATRALVREMAGEPDRAVPDLKEALKHGHPSRMGLLLRLGAASRASGRYDDAEEAYRQLIAHGDEESRGRAHLGLALVYEAKGLTSEAVKEYLAYHGIRSEPRLIKEENDPAVFLTCGAGKRHVPNPETLMYVSAVTGLQLIELVGSLEMGLYETGEPLKATGDMSLLQYEIPEEDSRIYAVDEEGQKRWIPNPYTFTRMGFRSDRISIIDRKSLDAYPEGEPIPSIETIAVYLEQG